MHTWPATLSFCTLASSNKSLSCGWEKSDPNLPVNPPSVVYSICIVYINTWTQVLMASGWNKSLLYAQSHGLYSNSMWHQFCSAEYQQVFWQHCFLRNSIARCLNSEGAKSAVVGMLVIVFFCVVNVLPSPPLCKFSFFSLLRAVHAVRSSNKICYKLSSLQALSAQ